MFRSPIRDVYQHAELSGHRGEALVASHVLPRKNLNRLAGKHSPKAWNIRMLLPLFSAFSGWLALTLHGFGEYLPSPTKAALRCPNE